MEVQSCLGSPRFLRAGGNTEENFQKRACPSLSGADYKEEKYPESAHNRK